MSQIIVTTTSTPQYQTLVTGSQLYELIVSFLLYSNLFHSMLNNTSFKTMVYAKSNSRPTPMLDDKGIPPST